MEKPSEKQCSSLDIMERGMHSYVRTKIIEFSSFLNGIGRISLINAGKEECEEFVFLLLTLKKNIKESLSQLGKSYKRLDDLYQCPECNELIPIKFGADAWCILQNHEHFEELYVKFLNGNLQTVPFQTNGPSEEVEAVPSTSSCYLNISNNENIESSVEQHELSMNEDVVPNNFNSFEEEEEYGTNYFRFNFKLQYDPIVEIKLYPQTLMKAVRRIDRVESYSIQRVGPFRVVCLICSCDLMSRGKVSKGAIMDHVMGQRHLKYSLLHECLDILQAYHEGFVNLDVTFQAHMVYFKPDTIYKARCVLCDKSVKYAMIPDHILTERHKLIVLDSFKKNYNSFYLINIQVLVYGVKVEMNDTKQEGAAEGLSGEERAVAKGKVLVKTPPRKKEKSESDSSPPSDVQEEHRIVKSIENPESPDVKDWLPYRYRDHLQFFKENGVIITCQPCQKNLIRNADVLNKHLRLSSHQELCSKTLVKYTFYCEICDRNFLEETVYAKHFKGPNKHGTMAESRKGKTTEYECANCLLVIYGDELSLLRHPRNTKSPGKERRNDKKEIKLPDQVQRMFASVETIETISQTLCEEANDNLNSNQLTRECCAKLESALGSVFGSCQAHPFGSRISGLGNKHSDLDVFIDTGDMYTGRQCQDILAQAQIVKKAALVLKQKDEFQEVTTVPTARTPIVKLYHHKTDIECDLSFRHGLSVENTKFIRLCIDIQPITQPFILMLKKWSSHNKMDEHITTYALAIMAIFYLQVKHYLLSVKKIKSLNPEEARKINGWETINYTMPVAQMKNHVTPYEHSVTRLLKDFFEYYSKFAYEKHVICPLLGHTITKDRFNNNGEKLPAEMRTYVRQLRSGDPEQFRSMTLFCIQDPFDLSHNLTKACQPGTVTRFRTLCDLTWKHLDAIM